jgi:hypothetical protein
MFPELQLEVMDRFTAVEGYFRQSRHLRGDSSLTVKGLVFVQVHAIHEFTVTSAVRMAMDAIAAQSHSYSDLRPSLLAMFLDAQLHSLRECGQDKVWQRRMDLFDLALSEDAAPPPMNCIPTDGTHFRHTQVQLILKVLGISRSPTLRRRHLYKIDEVVDNRNFIAHGEKTAEEVGRRYSRADIWLTIRQMKSSTLRMIRIVSEHCDEPSKHCR